MNDYNKFFEHKCHIDHVETLEEASEFCKAYGAELKKYAQDKEKEMEESGAVRENKDILIVLIILGAVLFVLGMSSEFETSIGAAVYSGLCTVPSFHQLADVWDESNMQKALGIVQIAL